MALGLSSRALLRRLGSGTLEPPVNPDEPEIPDLVLEAPTPANASQPSSRPAPTRSATLAPSGSAPRGTWGASQGDSLELEIGGVHVPSSAGQSLFGSYAPPAENEFDLFADDLGMTGLGLDIESAHTPEAEPSAAPPPGAAPAKRSERPPRTWPTGRTAAPEELTIDPLEISIAADYGPAPQSAALAPVYALAVFSQRRKLRPAEEAARMRLAQAERARERLLVELAESVRPILEGNDRMRPMLTALIEIESLTSERENALSRASADVAGTEGELDAKLESIAVEQELARKEADSMQVLAERADEEFKRLELQDKRIEIERRSVLEVARRKLGPAGGALPPELAQKLAELDARKAALAPDLENLRLERDKAKQNVDAAQSKLRALMREGRLLGEAKHDYRKRQQGELDIRARGVSDAEEQRRLALIGVGQRVLELRGDVPVDDQRLDALTAADDAVAQELLSAEKFRRALYSYDHAAEKQGRIVLIAAAALSLLGIVIAML